MSRWYPSRKCSADPACPAFVNLDLRESSQVQEAWAIQGDSGPEVMCWIDGVFANWWPSLTIERAAHQARILSA